ncbi:response regulator [Acaryochloris sp. IP29b_bin.148]|uniref:response regulator n=1 Tax=Acaryochloris sp. IP29b_bin.148 TaxID=2969218 RepID=UPI0026253273|nr:response regulator [Acaryochloris sp. IP29b_bin.148]
MNEMLLVEDDAGDIELMQEAISSLTLELKINVVRDGVEAMTYLHQQGDYHDARIPQLILLDLNLPCKSGREVLTEIRTDEALSHLPVIVLTTSRAHEDLISSYRLGANAFITKPIGLKDMAEIIQCVCDFYLNSAQLPNT